MTSDGLMGERAFGSLGRRLLTVLLVVALLLCHGAFGALHQVSWSTMAGPAHHATVSDEGAFQEHPQDHGGWHPLGSSDYAAALFAVLLLGTMLALLLGGAPPWGSAAGFMTVGRASAPPVLPPSRGPTAPLLQVFRL